MLRRATTRICNPYGLKKTCARGVRWVKNYSLSERKEEARMETNDLMHKRRSKLGTCARKCKGRTKGKFRKCVKKCVKKGSSRRRSRC